MGDVAADGGDISDLFAGKRGGTFLQGRGVAGQNFRVMNFRKRHPSPHGNLMFTDLNPPQRFQAAHIQQIFFMQLTRFQIHQNIGATRQDLGLMPVPI